MWEDRRCVGAWAQASFKREGAEERTVIGHVDHSQSYIQQMTVLLHWRLRRENRSEHQIDMPEAYQNGF